jgi:hypothetical protein
MDIPLKQIVTIKIAEDRERASVHLKNDDTLNGVLTLGPIEVTTLFGKVSIGIEHIEQFAVIPGGKTLPASFKHGLVLHYSFDKKEEDKATDTSGARRHGRLHGSTWTGRGKVGGARAFNGKSDYIYRNYTESSPLFPKDTPISIAVWFRTSVPSPIHQSIVGTHYAGAGHDGYLFSVDAQSHAGELRWGPSIRGGAVWSRRPVNDGKWHHAVGVWDGKRSSLYVDGVLQGTGATTGAMPYSHRASFRVGHLQNNNARWARDGFFYFRGTIDELMIFNRALSESEIQQLWRLQR